MKLLSHQRRLVLTLLTLAASACQGDADERFDELRRVWESDPGRAIELVNELDELEQIAAVELVFPSSQRVDIEPEHCGALSAAAARERCEQLRLRPHLSFYGAAERGDDATELSCLAALGVDVSEQDTPFGQALAEVTRPGTAELERGRALCGCLQAASLRGECAFGLAEALARLEGSRPGAVDACLGLADVVGPMCFEHVVQIANLQVDLRQPGGQGWALVQAFDARIVAASAEHRTEGRGGLRGFFWSTVLFGSVRAALQPDQEALQLPAGLHDRLPGPAQPHLRAAVAWALVLSDPAGARDPQAAVELAQAVLAGTMPLPRPAEGVSLEYPTRCPPDEGERGDQQQVYHYFAHLGLQRVGSADPAEDLGLALRTARRCGGL